MTLIVVISGLVLSTATMAMAETNAHGNGHYDGEKLAKTARITINDAQAIAIKARSGEVTDRELEKEMGGSGLRYSFDIKANGVTYEVGVDANTGAVLENSAEGKNPD